MTSQLEHLSQKILRKKTALLGILDTDAEQLQWIKIQDIDQFGRLRTALNEQIFLNSPSIKKIPVRLYMKFPADELQIQITGVCERIAGSESNKACEPGECLARIDMIYCEFFYREVGERGDIFSFFKERILSLLRPTPSKKILVLK